MEWPFDLLDHIGDAVEGDARPQFPQVPSTDAEGVATPGVGRVQEGRRARAKDVAWRNMKKLSRGLKTREGEREREGERVRRMGRSG